MYRAITRSIEVVVTPRFVADRSSPENNYFFWAYTISITNKGADTVQLKTRHWRITDAHGRQQQVRGANDRIFIRTLDATRYAVAVVADIAADPFGIGRVRECKPQGCRRDADQKFDHGQPPLPPRGQPRLRPALSIAERRFGSVFKGAARGGVVAGASGDIPE